jgi:signal transduction histidine kinase
MESWHGFGMLHEFISAHRGQIVERTRDKLARRTAPRPTAFEIEHGVPLFLDQFLARLSTDVENGGSAIGASAARHGNELLEAGLSIGQVVHDYGNICQAITELAAELQAQISNEDFRMLNMCLDIAIAEAVTAYAERREQTLIGRGLEQLGLLAHELRNLINTATLALDVVRTGSVGIAGSTGAVLVRSLNAMRTLVDRSLAEVRLEAGPPRSERIPVARLFEEIEIGAALEAKQCDVQLTIQPPEAGVAVEGDAQILASIVTNLVQNACKFTLPRGHVTLRSRLTPDRVQIDIADECGGLPAGKADELFAPYTQRGHNRSGVGLGLAISRKGAHAIGGDLSVLDLPGKGCVFTVDLRRSSSE